MKLCGLLTSGQFTNAESENFRHMSKKNAILFFLLVSALTGYGQFNSSSPNNQGGPVIVNAIVPQYCQGVSTTNNNRTPIWFWMEITGLTPGATYRYYTTVDTLNASPTSNGAGNPYLLNMTSGTIRRTTNPSLMNPMGHDSLIADNTGGYAGWFGVEPTGNGRFVPGNFVYPKIMLNNGSGGNSVAWRLLDYSDSSMVINYGTTTAATEGTALYDSLNATPKNFICLYDNTSATGQPISIAIVEDDGLDLYPVTSIANFYATMVDTMSMRWGTIVPNNLVNGIRALEERSFTSGVVVDVVTDADGWWCSGVNTAMMTGGSAGTYLNSTFILTASASIPDTVWVGLPANMNATTNDTGATITWDFGDTATATGANVTHTYDSAGLVSVTVIVSNGGCSDTIWHNVVVLLGTYIPRHIQLGFEVSPNPSTGEFSITSKSSIEKEVEIYNVLGDAVYTMTFTGNSTSIDLTGLEKGVYFMRIQENVAGGKTATKRIILQ